MYVLSTLFSFLLQACAPAPLDGPEATAAAIAEQGDRRHEEIAVNLLLHGIQQAGPPIEWTHPNYAGFRLSFSLGCAGMVSPYCYPYFLLTNESRSGQTRWLFTESGSLGRYGWFDLREVKLPYEVTSILAGYEPGGLEGWYAGGMALAGRK